MRRFGIALLVVGSALSTPGEDRVNLAGDKKTARQVWTAFETWLASYSKGELPAVMAIFDRDVQFSFQGAKDQGYSDLQSSYVEDFKSRKPGSQWVPTVEEVYADGRLAFVRAVWELRVTDADGKSESRARNRSLDVLRKSSDGKWRIFRSMNYPDRSAEQPAETTAAKVSEKPGYRFNPIHPMSEDVEILYGDPEKEGEPFVMRIRELPGGVIPPHRHPVDEHITVLQGTLYFGVGDKFDIAEAKELKAGSHVFIPRGSTMFGFTPEAAIVQVHGVGPFHIHWRAGDTWREKLKTLDDPDAASVFKFRRGESVVTKRGKGRIRQGYDSGEAVGYEIDGDDGSLFMALEDEVVWEGGKQ